MLKEKQAIIRQDTVFGVSDYFLAEINVNNGKYIIETSDLNIDKIRDKLKHLRIDKSSRTMSAYCKPGYSFRDDWRSIPKHEKVHV